MTATAETDSTRPAEAEEVIRLPMAWWREAAIMGAFYGVYTFIRNFFSDTSLNGVEHPARAFRNAMDVIELQRLLGTFHEETVQDWFLQWHGLIKFFNIFYGSAHFVVTIGVFVVLYRYRKNVFHLFRNALAITTALALVMFSLYPLMPPRLLDASCNSVDPTAWGGACYESPFHPGEVSLEPGLRPGEFSRFGFVDTLDTVKGLWSFNSDAMQGISNQYAAMPSLHIGWAAWCAFALWPVLRRRWLKVAVMGYPLLTFLVIVATGNHFWLDAAGGLVTLATGFALARWLQRWYDRRLRQRIERFRAERGLAGSRAADTVPSDTVR